MRGDSCGDFNQDGCGDGWGEARETKALAESSSDGNHVQFWLAWQRWRCQANQTHRRGFGHTRERRWLRL